MVPLRVSLFFILCFVIVNCTNPGEEDRELHESQIPPSYSQPSPDEIKAELMVLFKKYDKDSDASISLDEIKHWIDEVHREIIEENVERQWLYYEPHLQEVHSWQDYKPETKEVLLWDKYKNKTYPEELTTSEEEKNAHLQNLEIMYERAKRRWDVADRNNDTILVKEEFQDFIHPEYSDNEEVKDVLVTEALEDMDTNKDGIVSLEEYMSHMAAIAQEEERKDREWNQVQQDHFMNILDKNKDGSLSRDELKEWLSPKSDRHADEAMRLLSIVDKNANQRLEEDELLENFNQFFTLIPPNFWAKYMSDESLYEPGDKHDEL